jgi:hypothetical protein
MRRLKLIKGKGTRLEKWSHGKMLPKTPGSTNRIVAAGGHAPYLLEWDLYVNPEPAEKASRSERTS